MIYYLGMIGIAAFSITGVIAADKRGMDILSIIMLGLVTALGGGTLRDIILDSNPIFWIADLSYLWVSICATVVAFFFARYVNHIQRLLLFIDAFGLALFAVLATEKTIQLGFSYTVAVLMGAVTGIAGGMLRDVLTDRVPVLFGREFYATPALLGVTLFSILHCYFPLNEYGRLLSICVIFIIRAAAIQWGLYYPKWLIFGK